VNSKTPWTFPSCPNIQGKIEIYDLYWKRLESTDEEEKVIYGLE